MTLDAQGNWNGVNKRAEIKSVSYQHAKALALSGSAIVQIDKNVKLEKADLSLRSDDLQKLSAIYLKSFFEQTTLQGITFAGSVNADFTIAQNTLTGFSATVNKFAVQDTVGRIKVENGSGTLNWANERPSIGLHR